MATRIPLPGNMIDTLMSGLNTGSTMYSRAMAPILEREKQKQAAEQFKQQMALRQAAAGRNAQLFPLRLQELKDKHAAAEFERNMMSQLMGDGQAAEAPGGGGQDNYPALDKLFAGQGPFAQGEISHGNVNLNNRPSVPNPETGGTSTVWSMGVGTPEGEALIPRVSDDGRILSKEEAIDQFHKTGKHLGVYSSPEEADKAAKLIHEQQEQHMGQQSGQKGLNPKFAALMQNPMMRGWFKHKFGYDPLAPVAQTPEEKNASALQLFQDKEKIKQANKTGDIATNKVLTQNQQAVQAIDTVLPMIQEFIDHPETIYGPGDFSPSKKASYEAKTGGMIDLLVAAQSLPQVKESVNLVEQQIRRHTNESVDAYKKRLQDYVKDLKGRREKSVKVVKSKTVDTSVPKETVETKVLNGKTYRKIGGEWHEA